MIPTILDTDPGIDDAAAIVLALNHPEIDVRLMTTVVGNVDVEKTTKNALRLVEFLDSNVSVAKGASQPLIREFEDAAYAHGETGMDGYDFPPIKRELMKEHAVIAMRDEILRSKEPITLVAIGALTNLAILFKEYPETKENVHEIVIMGGALGLGNTHSAAEFNIYADPHAAKIVFDAGLPLTMIGLDVTEATLLRKEVVMEIKEANPVGEMFYHIFDHYRGGSIETGLHMHDACVIYYLIHRDKTKTKDYHVDIQLDGPAMGATVADTRDAYYPGIYNCRVGLEFDVDHFNQWFLDEILKLK